MIFKFAQQLYADIPMKSKSVLPDEGFEPRPVELVDRTWRKQADKSLILLVHCEPKGTRRNLKHRLFAWCKCGRHIPVGRMGQHWPKCTGAK